MPIEIDINKKVKCKNYSIIRGTTPTLVFKFPFLTSTLTAMNLTFMQDCDILLQKELTDFNRTGANASIKLTQAETLLFSDKSLLQAQVRCKTSQDTFSSMVFPIFIKKCLWEGEL